MKTRTYSLLAVSFLLLAANVSQAQVPRPAFDLSKIDGQVVKHFHEAWHISGNGSLAYEGVVLLYLNVDGSYRSVTLGRTNENKQATFKWDTEIIAIVHTHPRVSNPKPSDEDISLANRFGVPIFTITLKGMFMYDPSTKRITKVKDWLDWLDPSSWARREHATTKQAIKE